MSIPEALCSVLSGKLVPGCHDVTESVSGPDTQWQEGAVMNAYTRRTKQHRPSPLAKRPLLTEGDGAEPPLNQPSCVTEHEWVLSCLVKRRVVAAVPQVGGTVALSDKATHGQAVSWIDKIIACPHFNSRKSRRGQSSNRQLYQINSLFDGPPAFVPDGDSYGLQPAALDHLTDAGVTVEVRANAYGALETVPLLPERRLDACARELATTAQLARRGTQASRLSFSQMHTF